MCSIKFGFEYIIKQKYNLYWTEFDYKWFVINLLQFTTCQLIRSSMYTLVT